MMAMRSERVSASSWSWVTKIDGDAGLALDLLELDLHLLAQAPVERAQRLVEQQHLGLGDRARGPAPRAAAGRRTAARGLRPPSPDSRTSASISATRLAISSRGDAADVEAEGDILGDGQMREQRIGLEHHADARARCTGTFSTRSPSKLMLPASGMTKPAMARSNVVLPEPRRPEQAEELAVVEGDG